MPIFISMSELCETAHMNETHLYYVEGIKGVDSAHTSSTKELDRNTINATVHAFFAAQFAFVIGGHSPAFESNKFFKE